MTASWEEHRDRLRKIREEQRRCSEEVVEIWDDLYEFSYKLGDELWLIYEQVCVAACDCGRLDIATSAIDALRQQFPKSSRVKKLVGYKLEALGRYEDAEQLYRTLLEDDETNSIIRKRLVSILKAQKSRTTDAIKELNDYLKTYMSDYEAWMELSDMYVNEQDYGKAAYCMEELIMSNPHNHLYHCRYAEIKYTQGGQDNMELARSHFSQAVKQSPNSLRALYGLFMASSNIANSSRASGKVKKENIKFAAWAAEQIAERYREVQPEDIEMQHLSCLLDLFEFANPSKSPESGPTGGKEMRVPSCLGQDSEGVPTVATALNVIISGRSKRGVQRGGGKRRGIKPRQQPTGLS